MCDLGQREPGVALLQRALDLDPSNAQAHVAMGASLGLGGQLAAGIEQMRFGMQISPRDRRLGFWGWALGVFLLRAERAGEALAEARTAARRDPRFHLPHVLQAAALLQQGHGAEASAALATARQLCPALTLKEVGLSHGRAVAERLAPLWAEGAA